MLNYRETEILNNLIKGKKYTFKLISEEYGVSDRAARYYIDNIDYMLKILGYKVTERDRNTIFIEKNQNFKSLYEVLEKSGKLSVEDRKIILKLILFFDEKGLNITKICEELEVSRTTVKKDIKRLSSELEKEEIKLFYKNDKGYMLVGNTRELLIKKVELLEEVLIFLNGKNNLKVFKTHVLNYFYKYIKEESIENTKEFILEIKKMMQLNINEESYSKIFSYVLVLLNSHKVYENDRDMISRKFLVHTDEYAKIENILKKISGEKKLKSEVLIEITDLITGININNFKNNSFEDWINEELIIKKMISKVSKIVKIDLTRDEILYDGLLYHIKPAMYRIKNNISITNSVFKELILAKDPILDVVSQGVKEIERIFEMKFPEDEIALMGFHIKSSIERNTSEKTKRVILICGLGYGSSKVLEQSLKENYNLDIVDVLPYYLIEDFVPNYKNTDLILSTVELEDKYGIPVIKINPLLKEEDFILLSKYGIRKSSTKISMKKLIEVIENNTDIENRNKLVGDLKRELENKVIDDLSDVGAVLGKMLNYNNVKFLEKVEDWKEAIIEAGNILEKNGIVKKEYIKEMIKIVEKHGAYIVIEEGLAIPHAGISENVLKSGISLLVVKEKVFFPNGKGANIFLSFATIDKDNHLNIINDLFELVTKYGFIEKISQMSEYEELERYFRKELVC
ncbi:PRD domain-containing protein [Leptotrichia sp. OH3620_COT-345]|uniref:BglG family transcription antiterminator n=1 Tax=Leptotrichia sp. OH3620_COT-345 TaxID=2491048 RepID=UPI000F6470CE|nr:PTS sugar transporter subunit IIA [Leptotrichia sp. OH3620_COT-345]RRD40506.1 PRD domain-containing protein [Leptotrichia sp. OH3620_COT-345]